MIDKKDITFIVRGLSGGHGDFEVTFDCLERAVSCFQRSGYAKYPGSGSIFVRAFGYIEFELPWFPVGGDHS